MSSNLPPGVTQGMIDAQFEGPPCDICGFLPEDCICPECSICQAQGDRKCYRDHGLQLTAEQVLSNQKFKIARLTEQLQEERMYLAQLTDTVDEQGTFYPDDFKSILELDKLPPQKEHERFRHIAKAALEMSYDNGGINRNRTEAMLYEKLDEYLGADGVYTKDLVLIDTWLGTLTDEQMQTAIAGEHEDMMALCENAPQNTSQVLNDLFQEVI